MPRENRNSSIDVRSEEVREILGHIPHWIVRWGILLLFFTIALILFGSWVLKYPYVIEAKIYVTTENPPYNAVAKTDGRIATLFVEDNQNVRTGEIMALIESTADLNDVQDLKKELDAFRPFIDEPGKDTVFHFPGNLSLSDIQPSYANFLKKYEDLINFIELDYHAQKIHSVREEIKRYRAYSWTLKRQSKIINDEVNLAGNQFTRDSTLYSQGVIPQADYEKSKSAYLVKQRAYEESRSVLVNNEIQISKLEQSILDLELQKNDETGKLQLQVIEAFDNLTADLASWDQKYVLRSRIDGVVSFTRIWSANQNVRTGDIVMTVIPEDAGDIIGKIELPIAGSGKVKPGEDVNIKFANFPYMEYGMVKGRVRNISLVASDNAYSVLVGLPHGLTTTYSTKLKFTQEMQGIAEIITDDARLLERIVNPVKSVITRQKDLNHNGVDH
ncbi:MAG TPA: HlyD family efflux transporter periplasmic adaptor subunit [Bacteroidales bacterium]|nr:HlyD family efflux transporter periplasmic adaptor subunit [Bacteroidales bacterium]